MEKKNLITVCFTFSLLLINLLQMPLLFSPRPQETLFPEQSRPFLRPHQHSKGKVSSHAKPTRFPIKTTHNTLKKAQRQTKINNPSLHNEKTRKTYHSASTSSSAKLSPTAVETYWVKAGNNGNGITENQPAGNITFLLNTYDLTNDIVTVKSGTYAASSEDFPLLVDDSGVTIQAPSRNLTIVKGNSSTPASPCFQIDADDVTIKNLTIANHWRGIELTDTSENSSLLHNHFKDNYIGIHIDGFNHYIEQNTMQECGIALRTDKKQAMSLIIENNIVNGKPLRFYKNTQSIKVPQDTGQAVLVNCNHSLLSNLTISNSSIGIQLISSFHNTITKSTITSCNHNSILFKDSNKNTIEHSTIIGAWTGIHLRHASSNTIRDNVLYDNGEYGIHADQSSKNGEILANNITKTERSSGSDGIYLEKSPQFFVSNNNITGIWDEAVTLEGSSNITLQENRFKHNDDCMNIQGGSDHNIVQRNSFLTVGDVGISITDSRGNVLTANAIKDASKAIALSNGARENTIRGNTITENEVGIYLEEVENNKIYWNNFINNTVHVNETSGGNVFNSTWIGNFWSDYTGDDLDRDGIGDSPYYLPEGLSTDYLPAITPFRKTTNRFLFWINNDASGNGSILSPAGNLTFILSHYNLTNSIVNVQPGIYNVTIETFPLQIAWTNVTVNAIGSTSSTIINGQPLGEEDKSWRGFTVTTDNVLLRGFTFTHFNTAVYLDHCSTSSITANHFSNCYITIYLEDATQSFITNNIMYGGGIRIHGSQTAVTSHTIDTSNLVNEDPIRYYTNQVDITVPRNTGQLIFANCNASTVTNFTFSNTSIGLQLLYAHDNVFTNISCNDNSHGIHIYSSDNNTITHSTVTSNYWGINIDDANNNTFSHNNISHNFCNAIYQQSSTRNKFKHNSILDNGGNAFQFESSPITIIQYNDIRNNGGYGITMRHCNDSRITHNSIVYNGKKGVYLYNTHSLTISYNIIAKNPYGLYLNASTANLVYRNDFNDNGLNAKDTYGNNHYNNTNIGNYWNDYQGQDTNGDGIGETPYNVSGSTNAQDYRPSVDPINDDKNPSLSLNISTDNTILQNTVTVNIFWNDTHPDRAVLYCNNSLLTTWTSSGYHTYMWDTTNEENGFHKLTLQVNDTLSNTNHQSLYPLVDNSQPHLSITTPSDGATINTTGSLSIEWSAYDDTTEITYYLLQWQNESKNITVRSYTITDIADGSHTIQVKAFDKAGNTATKSITIEIIRDTDQDGLADPTERNHGTDPSDSDTDNDDLCDGKEVHKYGTDPTDPDTDGDGADDGEEIHKYGTDPLDPSSSPILGMKPLLGKSVIGGLLLTVVSIGFAAYKYRERILPSTMVEEETKEERKVVEQPPKEKKTQEAIEEQLIELAKKGKARSLSAIIEELDIPEDRIREVIKESDRIQLET